MAIDFMTALRSRARAQERSARLSGRPQTQLEAAAPYVAMAETASDRLARSKALALQEQGQNIQQSQFGETLEFQRQTAAENQRLERERLEAQRKMEAARLAEIQRQTDLQMEAAEKARELGPSDYANIGLTGVAAYKALGGGPILGTTAGLTGTEVAASAGSYSAAADAALAYETGGAVTEGISAGAGTSVGAGAAYVLGPLEIISRAAGGGSFIGNTIGRVLAPITNNLCIIISACTDPHSYEVELSRVFRDRYLGPLTLSGYYALASLVAPTIKKYRGVRWFTHALLIKRLVDYGEWVLGLKSDMKRPLSRQVSTAFLGLCKWIGKGVIR
jgi:hypothetical protein